MELIYGKHLKPVHQAYLCQKNGTLLALLWKSSDTRRRGPLIRHKFRAHVDSSHHEIFSLIYPCTPRIAAPNFVITYMGTPATPDEGERYAENILFSYFYRFKDVFGTGYRHCAASVPALG